MGALALWLPVLGRAEPPWLQPGKLLLQGGQGRKGQRLGHPMCRWPQAQWGLKVQRARRRGLRAQPLLSSELCHHCQRWRGAAAAPGSAGAALSVLLSSAELSGFAVGNQFWALETVFGWCLAFCAR